MWDRQSVAVVGITLLAAFLRFFLIGDKSVWLDEAFSIWLARHPLTEMWGWLVRIDQHPPLYYTLLHIWVGLFGDLQGAVRGLSALCSTLTVPLFYAGVGRLIDRPTALVAAFLLAISPFHIYFAQEARMYSLLTLAVAAALYCVVRIMTDKDAPRRVWWGLAGSQAAAMLTHNTAAVYFPLALNLAIWMVYFNAEAQRRRGAEGKSAKNKKRDADDDETKDSADIYPCSSVSICVNQWLNFESGFWRRWLIFQGVALLLWSPWAWPFVVQSIGVDRQFWMQPPTGEMLWETLRSFSFAFQPDWLPFLAGWMALYLGLALLGVWHLRRTSSLGLFLSLLIVPILLALLVSLRRPIFAEHTLIWITLPYYALIGAGIRGAAGIPLLLHQRCGGAEKRVTRTRVQIGLLTVILFLSGLSLNNYYFWFQKEGWDEAAAYVAAHVQPDDLIVFHATWVQIPFDYYYHHYELETERRGLPVDLFDRGVLEPQMAESDVPYLRQLVGGRPRLWLIYSHDWYTDPERIIPRELARTLRETEQKEFNGIRVILYQVR